MTQEFIRNDSAEFVEVQRWDAGNLPAPRWEPTQQEGLRAPARFARSGVLEYRTEDGKIRREWIPPEELFDPESMASLRDAPIVVYRHPASGRVTPENYSRLTVGHVSGIPEPEGGEFLSGWAVIQELQAVEDALEKHLSEFSTGCLMRLELTAGVVPDGYPDAGKPYDVIQRRRRYNHVAFLSPGSGRAGPEVTLRLDSKGNQLGPTEETPTQQESIMELTEEEKAAIKAVLALAPKLQALMGEAPVSAPAVANDSPKAAPAAATPAVAAPAAPAAAPAAQKEEQRTDSQSEPKAPAAVSPEEQERIRNDAAFAVARDITKATAVLGAEQVQKLGSIRQVMEATCLRVDSKFTLLDKTPDKMTDGELRMAFEAALREHSVRNDSAGELAKAREYQLRTDADDEPSGVTSKLRSHLDSAYKGTKAS